MTTQQLLEKLPLSSPNLPFGKWTYLLNSEGNSAEIFNDSSIGGNTQTFMRVYLKDGDSTVTRKLYINAVINPEAEKILFDSDGLMLSSAVFGVYNDDGYLKVSNDENEVITGILADLKSWEEKGNAI